MLFRSHLGTIAKSGTKSFLESMGSDQAKDSQLIGPVSYTHLLQEAVNSKRLTLTEKTAQEAVTPDETARIQFFTLMLRCTSWLPFSAFSTSHWEYGSPRLERYNGCLLYTSRCV